MVPAFSPLPGGVSVSATASSVASAITMPSLANALYVANTSTTLFVGVAAANGTATATLSQFVLPPLATVLIEVPQGGVINSVAAIGSAAGPTAVVFTPAYVQR